MFLSGYCRGCGQSLVFPGNHDSLCPICRAGRAGQAVAQLLSRDETALLERFDFESARRLRRLRRRIRTGRLFG